MKTKRNIYLDNNATTLLDPRVVAVLQHHLEHEYGNPSSLHTFGQAARGELNKARRTIAALLCVKPSEILFTSGGSEGANMILHGLASSFKGKGHVISSDLEHPCVYETLKKLELDVTFLSPGAWGAVTPDAVQNAMRPDTRLIALMAANNETGVKTDIESLAKIATEARVPLFVDGVALLGKELFAIPEGVSAMCFSGHKIHCPPGIGFVFVRSSLNLPPLHIGGEQEFGKRGGTENLLGVVGLKQAVALLEAEVPTATLRMEQLRNHLEKSLQEQLEGVTINGLGPRLANTSNLSFAGIEGETLLTQLDLHGIAASHGSACASGALEPSRVLRNMGLSKSEAGSSIRFSLSRMTTLEEIERCIDVTAHLVTKLRINP